MRKGIALAASLALAALGGRSPLRAQGVLDDRQAHLQVEQGSEHFFQGHYDEALDAFAKAQSLVPQSPEIEFDVATASYKKALTLKDPKKRAADLARTIELYAKVVNAADPKLRAAAFYGMGNAAFHAGQFQQSADDFEKSLEANPKDRDCKRNLELVRRMLSPKKHPPSPSPSGQPSPNPSATPKPTPSGRPSPQPSASPSARPSPGASPSPSPGASPSPRPVESPEPSPAPAPSPSPGASAEPMAPSTTTASPSPTTTQDISRVLESLKEEVSSIRELYKERLKKIKERPVEVDW